MHRPSRSSLRRTGQNGGFGDFRSDQGLTEEQLELIVDWEEGGAPEGEEKDLPAPPKLKPQATPTHAAAEIVVSGDFKLTKAIRLDGLPVTTRNSPARVSNDTFSLTSTFS